jgi:hypothetical protein
VLTDDSAIAEQTEAAGHIEKRFIEGEWLDERRCFVEDLVDVTAD